MEKLKTGSAPPLPLENEFAFLLPEEDFEKTEKLWWATATSFAELFQGNSAGFYWYKSDDGSYEAAKGQATVLDFMEHLFGYPNRHILSVPIGAEDRCYWACIDPDRHLPDQPPIDWGALARRITELRLPLVLCKSKRMKGANVFCFFKGKNGVAAVDARRIMAHYSEVLELGDAEIFPKQETLKSADSFGNGVCLPYHHTRGYDAEGNEIESVRDFIDFCWERAVYSDVVLRDLPGGTEAAGVAPRASAGKKTSATMKAADARGLHQKNLAALRAAAHGNGNELLNSTAFFASRALPALGQTEAEVKGELLSIVTKEWKDPHERSGAEATIRSGWTSGIAEPLTIVFPPKLEWMNSSQQIVMEQSPAIVNRLVYAASATALIAKPKVGKTTLLLDLSEAVNYGRPFLDEETMQGSVLYVSEQPLASFYAELLNSGLQSEGQMKLEAIS